MSPRFSLSPRSRLSRPLARQFAGAALLTAAALVASPAVGPTLAAQSAPLAIASPIPLAKSLNVDGEKQFKGADKILIPTVVVRFATRGSLTVVNQGRFFETDGKTAKAKGKFVVAGLDKEYVQGLALQIQNDLVARLRGAGYTVLTYDDIKGNPEVVAMKRHKADADYGMPTGGGPPGSKNTYLMAFPSDEQAIDPPFQGYAWGFRKLLKEMDVAMLVPEYIIDAPLLTGSKKHGVSSRGASVAVFPEMVANGFYFFATAKGGYGSIRLKDVIGDVADDVGEIGDAKDDSPKLANAIAAGLSQLSALGADLQAKSGTWGLKVDRAKYSAGVIRGLGSLNMAATDAMRATKQ